MVYRQCTETSRPNTSNALQKGKLLQQAHTFIVVTLFYKVYTTLHGSGHW